MRLSERRPGSRRSPHGWIAACLCVVASGCATVETALPAREYRLRLSGAVDGVSVWQHAGAGAFVELAAEGRAPGELVYLVRLPAMDGGYSSFLGCRYEIHDPATYEVLRVRRGAAQLRSLSPRDLEALPAVVEAGGGRTYQLAL